MSNMIVAQPTTSQIKSARKVIILVFTFFGMVGMLVVIGRLPTLLVIPALIAMPIPGFLLGIWYSKKKLTGYNQYWQLTDTELSCGANGQKKFLVAGVEKIIVGLPPSNLAISFQKTKPNILNFLAATFPTWNLARNVASASSIKENSILICFKDGSWLPLRLYLFPNGRALMDALRERCKDRVVESYNYSPEELRRLRGRNMNELIPPP
jgi:hypothetical protein